MITPPAAHTMKSINLATKFFLSAPTSPDIMNIPEQLSYPERTAYVVRKRFYFERLPQIKKLATMQMITMLGAATPLAALGRRLHPRPKLPSH